MSALNAPRKFRITAPCSTANIGPGFDVLGISLSMYLSLDVEIGAQQDAPFVMTYSGEGAKDVPLTPEHNLITKTALYVLSANGIKQLPQPLKIHVQNPIPLGRGLGSSGAAVVAGVLLGNALGQLKLGKDRLLDYCLMIERHPDNVAAALMGGFVASYLRELDPEDVKGVPASESLLDITPSQDVPQPPSGIGHFVRLNWANEIKAIAIVPQFEVATVKARSVLPQTYDRADMIFNFQRLAVLTTALGRSPPDADLIYNAMQDKVHQPYRKTLIPGLPEILSTITPAKYDGLLGICLSGAGPTILALATHNFEAIAEAARAVFAEHGIKDSFYRVLDVDTEGANEKEL
ncbi:homoserine kinase [Radiomyces spectabilis]|uniref:homoserine kinase n=1 Tax=Radiomyces spectabilis TaxID=64574 RepID=UPI002220E27F|nr:homoserine kinase [Radiomyces spectabilis]KAI8367652.1 homoserine kinase [Radiomyces spectabilis]